MGVTALVVAVPTLSAGVLCQLPTLSAILTLAFLARVRSGLAYYLWFQAVMEHGPARVGSLIYLEPFVSLGIATATLNEPVTGNAVAGGICVLIGVWLIARGGAPAQTESTAHT